MTANNYTVYVHINKANYKKYFGITSQIPKRRWQNGHGYTNNPYFYNAIQKYGWDGFDHLILFWGLTEEEAKAKEKELIAAYETRNDKYGYNLTEGGDGTCGYQHSEETKEKLSKARKEYYKTHEPHNKGVPLSAISREHLRQCRTEYYQNNAHPMLGKHHSETTKEKIKDTQISKGYTRPVICLETKDIYSSVSETARALNCSFGSIQSVCSRRYGCKTIKGLHFQFYDDYLNGEQPVDTENIIGGKAKQVICLTTGVVYKSAREASRQTGICDSSIGKCCRGHQSVAGGFEWAFIEES